MVPAGASDKLVSLLNRKITQVISASWSCWERRVSLDSGGVSGTYVLHGKGRDLIEIEKAMSLTAGAPCFRSREA